jgi:hypothetical protein
MRAALSVVITVVVVAGCGGGTKKPVPVIENNAVVQAEPWTVARVRATLPPDAALVVKLETRPIRTSEVIGSFWTMLSEKSFAQVGVCQAFKDLDMTMVLVASGTQASPVFSIWILDTSASALRTCFEQLAAGPPDKAQITIDGDFVTIATATGGSRGAVVILDDHAAFMTIGKAPILDRAQLLAATQDRLDTIRDAELDELFVSLAPVWAFASGTAPMFGSFPMNNKFRTAAVTVGLGKLMAVDALVHMTRPEEAATVAQLVQAQGQSAVQMGMADELRASADAGALVVHVAFSKAALQKVVNLLGGMLGGIINSQGVVPTPPPAPAPAPAP